MKSLVRIRRIILTVLLLMLIAFISKTYLFGKHDSTVEKSELLQQDTEYDKKRLEDRTMQVKRISESISNEIEIVVLKEIGNIKLFHDKTPKNNKYIEWIIDSNITLKVYYTAIFTIDAESIEVYYDESVDKINIIYSAEKIKVKSVNIDDILSETSKGIFGKKYSENEVTALTLLVTDKIKEELANDESLKLFASINLEGYLNNMAYMLGIFNTNVIQN